MKALKHIRFGVLFETKMEKSKTIVGPKAARPNFTGLNASLCTRLYHISMKSAIGSSFSF